MWAFAGVSVVNAIPSGLGSTMALNLRVEVEICGEALRERSRLVKTILDYFRERYGMREVGVVVRSPIPQNSGLKSSSAVSVALIEALKSTLGLESIYSPLLSAELSLKAGVSVTGAFDDATAAYHGGVSFTDNYERRVIALREPPEGVVVVVGARGGRGRVDASVLRGYSSFFREVFGIALRGDILKAMTLNGLMVAKLLGYDDSLIARALSLNALAAGVSGNGPSVFAVAREGEEGPLVDLLSWGGFEKVLVARPARIERM